MATDSSKLYEAFEEEGKDVDVDLLMQEMLNSFTEETGKGDNSLINEYRIRKMLLARKFIEKDVDRLTLLKKAIVADWDARIKKEKEKVASINEFVDNWLRKENKGKKLSLDIATVNLKRNAPKTVVSNVQEAKDFLAQHNELDKYLKPAELDVTLLQNAYINDFKAQVKALADAQIAEEIKASEKGKITKSREKQILLEVEQKHAEEYFTKLPEFMEFVPESESLVITMK